MLTGGFERIAVVDIDVHHGNGTQEVSLLFEFIVFLLVFGFSDFISWGGG
jgi:acetoin utilization deacetylase AcuC-like enzyme